MKHYSRYGGASNESENDACNFRTGDPFGCTETPSAFAKNPSAGGKEKKSISEQVWDLCELGLDKQAGTSGGRKMVPLPGADLVRVFTFDRKELYNDIWADKR